MLRNDILWVAFSSYIFATGFAFVATITGISHYQAAADLYANLAGMLLIVAAQIENT